MTPGPVLELDGLSVHYPVRRTSGQRDRRAIRAVDDVSLHIDPGEALGLVGESGCGKSSLARAVVRLIEPTDGTIRFEGTDITHLRGPRLRELRRHLRIVFQDPYASLNPRLTVAENIARPLRIQGLWQREGGRARVLELLGQVGLPSEVVDRLPRQLSGGQRQRVGIARALAPRPRLVVLDEPVSSLDASVRAQILRLLADLRRELGVSYLFIGHDLSAIRQLADRVAVMYLGKVAEIGDRDEVFDRPRHPYTCALLSAVPVADPVASRTRRRIVLAGELPDPANPPVGCSFRTRCWRADARCATQPPLEGDADHRVACHHPE